MKVLESLRCRPNAFGGDELQDPLPEHWRRTALSRFPLIHDGLTRSGDARAKRRLVQSHPLSYIPDPVGVIDRDGMSAQSYWPFPWPQGFLELRVQEVIDIGHGRAHSEMPNCRPAVIGDLWKPSKGTAPFQYTSAELLRD